MAVPRDNPYNAFTFQVIVDRFGGGNGQSIQAGFQEVSGLGMEIAVSEYRNGNEPVNHVRKIYGMDKYSDVTLKRGLIGQTHFFQWLKEIREGSQAARRTVTIQLMDEAHTGPVMTWKLIQAFPNKYTGPSLNGKGGEVAIEELVLAYEQLDIE